MRSDHPLGTGLEVALFGHVRLAFDGKPFEFTAPRKTLPILAYLLLHRHAAVSREFLAFLMWPDADEEVARNNLRRNLTLFKQILPPPAPAESWILASNELVRWNPDAPFTLDVAEFDRLCGESQSLAAAVDLYVGDLLESLYDDWVYPERERLRSSYLSALKTLLRRHRSERDFARAIGYGRRLLAADPLREDVAREIAAVRYQAGDRSGALGDLDDFVKRLHAELGIDAMPETQALRESILRGAPAEAPSRELEIPSVEGRRRVGGAELPFVGRDGPLERAGFLWDRAARGAGAVGFVGGEAGIGKTRFAAEFALRAEEQGGRVLLGAASSPESYPYQPFCEALRGAIPLLVAANLERVWLSALVAPIPELAARLAIDRAPPLRPDEERKRLFEAFGRALIAISRTRPLLLILEDMHWCEAGSAELLGFVADRIAAERIAIFATYRNEEITRGHPLRSVRRALLKGASLILELPRLDREAVAKIVAQVAETGGCDAGSTDHLYARSSGNPLFLGELIREASESSGDTSAEVPATIESTIAARLARLNGDARRAAGVCAVVGDTFDFELICEVTGWESGVLLDALDELIERHVVRETTHWERGAYAFTHNLIRATAYAELPLDARRRYHGVTARAIGALYAAQADAWAPELARHYEGADEPLAAAAAWLQAARAAMRMYANAEAFAAATRSLHLYRSRGDARGEFEVLLLLIDLRIAANRYDENREDLERASELARIAEDPQMSARLLQSAMMESIMKQDFPTVHRMAGELLDLSRAAGDLLGEGKAHERRAAAANRMFSISEAIDEYAKAHAIYESIGERRGIYAIENNWGSLDIALGMVSRGRGLLEQLLDRTVADGDVRMQYFALSNLGVAAYYDGDFALAKGFELRALDLARQLGSDAFAALVLGDLGVAERELGNLDPALAYLEEAVAIHRRLDQRLELWTNLARLALVCAARGEMERARDIARDVVERQRVRSEEIEDPAEVLWNAARTLHACGDEREALEVAERAALLQEARLAAIDVPEYRESAAGLRWYRALQRLRATGSWPGEDDRATAIV